SFGFVQMNADRPDGAMWMLEERDGNTFPITARKPCCSCFCESMLYLHPQKCQLIAQRVKVRQRRLYTISVSTQPALAARYSLIAARSASITWQREGSRSIPCSEG